MWLLETGIKERIEKAEQAGVVPTAEQQADFIARHEAALAGTTPAIMSVVGDRAQIEIKGTLTNTPSFLAMLFGGGNTTYPEIIAAIAAAENDDSISNIILAIDSPGGLIDGLFDTLNAISKTKKPIQAVVSNLAASAAFAIASQADEIIASNHAASVGSIGIAVNIPVSENRVTITSTPAPKKRPDVTTPEGVAVIKEELDAIHEIFVEAIATGRSAATGKSVSVNDVNADFGQGATLLAREALKRGMIDSIAEEGLQIATSPDSDITGLADDTEIMAGATPPFKDYPIEDRQWDATAAVRRWRRHTGSTDKPSRSYRNGFFWFDNQAPDEFGSYKLPFVDIVDGRIKTIRRGVFTANGAMAGARGQRVQIPAADRPKVQRHIDRYRTKIEKEDEPNNANREGRVMDLTMLKQDHPGVYEAAVQVGVAKERDRAKAHLILGREAGAIEAAMKAVEEGTEMTAAMSATYMAAAMNRKDVKDRTGDDGDTGTAVTVAEGAEGKDAADRVADAVCEALNYEETAGGVV